MSSNETKVVETKPIEKKVDIPEANDIPSLFLRSFTKISVVVVGYVLMVIISYLLNGLFGGSKVFILLYVIALLFIISGIGTYNSYIFSNILTGLSVAFGIQLMDPMKLVGIIIANK
jgi:hypothetical protein